MNNRRHGRIARAASFLLLGVAFLVFTSSAYALHSYGVAWRDDSNTNYNGVRMYVEGRGGSISDADANSGRFILQDLWAITGVHNGTIDYWVECGVMRGWIYRDWPSYFWAEQHMVSGSPVFTHHEILTPDVVQYEDHHWVKIQHISGTSDTWGVYIDGSPANAADGINRAQGQNHNYFHKSEAGLECTAPSGHYGSSTSWANVDHLGVTTNHGSSWPNWSGASLLDTDDALMHRRWASGETYVHLQNYRNTD